jgi:preprotein translocase subunit Sec61beta
MAQDNKIQMPSSQGGLVRYFDEYKSRISLKPGHVIILVVIVVLIEILLHFYGLSLLGIQ